MSAGPGGSTRVVLVRHGVPDAGSGHMDPDLSETGWAEAEAVGAWLARERPVAVYASSLRRAWQTATPLARRLGLTVHQRDDLREWVTGRTHYVRPEDLLASPEGLAFAEGRFDDFVPEHDHVGLRGAMVGAVRDIALRHPGQTVVAASHGGAINTLLGFAIGTERAFFFDPAYTGCSRVLVWPDGRVVLQSVNETPHLDVDRLRAVIDDLEPGQEGVA